MTWQDCACSAIMTTMEDQKGTNFKQNIHFIQNNIQIFSSSHPGVFSHWAHCAVCLLWTISIFFNINSLEQIYIVNKFSLERKAITRRCRVEYIVHIEYKFKNIINLCFGAFKEKLFKSFACCKFIISCIFAAERLRSIETLMNQILQQSSLLVGILKYIWFTQVLFISHNFNLFSCSIPTLSYFLCELKCT